jgi:hypothetical protein
MEAMPPVIAFIAQGITFIATMGAAGSGIAALVVATTAVVAASRLLKPKINFSVDDNDRSRQTTVRSTTEPRKLVYGETLVSGPLTYAQVSGANNKYMHQVVALAGHELTAIKKVYFDDKIIDLTNSGVYNPTTKLVTSGFFGPKNNEAGTSETIVYIDTRLGATSQTVYAGLRADAKTATEYLATHLGNGVASLYTRWTINEGSREVWDEVGTVQNIKALVQGKKVYDPRLEVNAGGTAGASPANASYVVYDNDTLSTASIDRGEQGKNPALMIADYLMDSEFGLGIASTKIDWSAIITAADACDTLVPIPNSATQKRFFGSGVIFGADPYAKSIEKILSGMNGSLAYSQGKYIAHAGIFVQPSEDITEDDIIGKVDIRTAIPRSDRLNQIKGLFIDPTEQYKMMEFGPVTVSGAIARDNGEVLEEEIKLPFTDNRYAAQRIAFKQVNQSFLQTVITVPVNLKGMRIAIGDRVRVYLSDLESVDSGQWNPKIFKCINWSFAENGEGGINLTLIEDAEARYNDPAATDYSTITAAGVIARNLPDVPAPTNFGITAAINSIELSWDNPSDALSWEQIWVYRSTSATTPTDSDTPIVKFRGTSYTDQRAAADAQGNAIEYYYWIQAVRYPQGSTPASGSNVSKSAMLASSPAKIGATKIGFGVMGEDSIDTAQIIDSAVGSDQIAVTIQSDNFSVANETGWQINKNGDTTFNNTVVRGNISATTGTVGGFTIGSTNLIAGDGATRVSLSTDDGISLGNNTFASAPFRVTRAGALTATGATITGAITATSGTFTGTVNASAGEFTGSVSIGSNAAIYGGTMDSFNDGLGFFLGHETGAYKLSVGDSSGEVMTWDGSKLNVEANTVSFSTGGEQDYSSESRYTTSQKSATVVLANNSDYFLFDNRRQDLAFPDFIVSYYLGPLTSGTQSSAANAINGIMENIEVELFYTDASTGSPGTWTSLVSVDATSWDVASGPPFPGYVYSNFRVKESGTYVASLDTRNGILDDYPTISPFGDALDGTSVPVGLVDNDYFINIPLSKNTFVFPKGRYFIKVVITITDGSLSPYPATGSPTATERRISIPNASSFVHPDFGQSVFVGGAHTTIFTDNNRDNETLIKGGSVYLMSKEGANAADQDSTAIFFGGRGTTGGTPSAAYGPLHGLYFFNDRDSIGSGSGILGSIGSPQFSMYVPYDGSKLTFGGDVNFTDGLYINGVAVNAGAVTGPAGSNTQVQFNNSGSLGASSDFTFNDSTDTLTVKNLTVSGTTTTVNTDNLTVKDPNITLNYSTGDSSSTANNSGITIQDAVNSTTDASLLWKTASDTFEFSHGANIPKTYVNATSEDAVSGVWTNASSSSSWGTIKFGAGFAWTDTVGGYKQFNIPTGADTCYMSQLKWSSGGYVDVHAVQADGDLVFLGRIGTGQSVENNNHLNTDEHDAQAIDKIGSGLDAFSAIRITNRRGRFHFTGVAFSTQQLDNFNGGMIAAEMLHSGVLSNVTNTNWDAAYTYSQVGHLPLAGGTLTGTLAMGANAITSTGTISSGAITSSGTSNFGNFQLTDASKLGFGTVKSGASVGHTASVDEGIFWHTGNEYGIYRTAGAWASPYPVLKIRFDTGVDINGGPAGVYGDINFSTSNLKMGGTQFLDQSRNLTNIGTISSASTTTSGTIKRTASNVGHLEGTYNNVGANGTHSNPIYTIGSAYNPTLTALSSMYGIGYCNVSASFINFTGGTSWGMYVAADGDARVWLDGSSGVVSSTGQHYVGSNVVWNAGNDGSGSGLDADLLDSLNSTQFLRSDTADTASGAISFTGGHGAINITSSSIVSSATSTWTGNPGALGKIQYHSNRWYIVADSSSNRIVQFRRDGGDVSYIDNNGTLVGGGMWSSYNDGSGSGLDADLLDSLNSTSFLRSDVEATQSSSLIIAANWSAGQYNGQFVIQGSYPSWETRGNSSQPYGWLHHQDSYGNYTLYSIAGYTGTSWTQRFTFNHGDQTIRNGGPSGNVYYHQGNDGSGSGLDADLLDGANSSDFISKFGTTYYQATTWIQCGGAYGLYVPTVNGAHFLPNTTTNYATWRTAGTRGGYDGINFSGGGAVAIMYDAAGNGGIYRQANGRWHTYHHVANNCLGVCGSTTSSAYGLYEQGGGIYSTGNITAYSDRRVKENIRPIDNALATVEQMRGVYYNRIEDAEKKTVIGFIAQELNEIDGAKPLVTYAEDVDQYGVSYGNTAALLVEAIKDLSQQVKDLQAEIKEIKNA